MREWRARATHLADELSAKGVLRTPAWRDAVLSVPRHVLVPAYFEYAEGSWRSADTTSAAGRERWLNRVYSNSALFTLPGGLSSSSMPSLMVRMLEDLDVHDGCKVLEIGTGSGYNAALLSRRLGDGNVFSVDIEPDLVQLAQHRLAELGYHPTLAARDGADGLPEHAPYDRIIATCSVRAVPWAWIEQVAPGALILVDVKAGTGGNLVLLRRLSDRAEGRFDARAGSFMPMRHHPVTTRSPRAGVRRDRDEAAHGLTRLDMPRPWEHPLPWFLAHLASVEAVSYGQLMDPTGKPGDAFVVDADGSWCEIATEPDETGSRHVWQAGPRRLWDELEAAHDRWVELGSPGWERFGLTVTSRDQTVWLDSPTGARWALPTSMELVP